MEVALPYGKGFVDVMVPNNADVVYPKHFQGVIDVRKEIRRAMDEPIGCQPLVDIARGKSDAVIVINDVTRPAPSRLLLEEILKDLTKAGIREDAVTIIIACGNHRPVSTGEIHQMVGSSLANRLRILNHDCEDETNLTYMGKTDLGLPIWVNSALPKSSLTILTGLIAPHHTAGYSGGRKSVVPGVAGLRTLIKHHSFPIRSYDPCSGWMKNNPFHEEAVKGARVVGVDFIVNVVKNDAGEVVRAVAGELEAAHESGVSTCAASWIVEVPHRYDIAVVTPGGHPRDIDLHQAQKAMSTAEGVTEHDGVIVLVAECSRGVGKFANWLKEARSPKEVIDRFCREGFTPEQSSKAFMCARALDRYTVIVSCKGIPEAELEQMLFKSESTPQAAIDEALKIKGVGASMLIMPYAVSCIPCIGAAEQQV
jgi:nickel-dependent lactate racemase